MGWITPMSHRHGPYRPLDIAQTQNIWVSRHSGYFCCQGTKGGTGPHGIRFCWEWGCGVWGSLLGWSHPTAVMFLPLGFPVTQPFLTQKGYPTALCQPAPLCPLPATASEAMPTLVIGPWGHCCFVYCYNPGSLAAARTQPAFSQLLPYLLTGASYAFHMGQCLPISSRDILT